MTAEMDTVTAQLPDEYVMGRVDHLKSLHESQLSSRRRIKNILNGGESAVAELLGADAAIEFQDIPLPNLMIRGMTVLAQKIGRAPTLKVPTMSRQSESDAARENAELRERIIEGYDQEQRLELQLPQLSRWLLGYGFAVFTIRDYLSPEGYPYPIAEMRDPFDCYPGYWGPTQRPQELAVIRQVPAEDLARMYPRFRDRILQKPTERPYTTNWHGNRVAVIGDGGMWESGGSGMSEGNLEVAEYMDRTGTYMAVPEREIVVDFIPNPLSRNVPFVVPRRFTFDELTGHYDHLIGLMVAMVKMTILGVVAMEDGVFVETNVRGEVMSGEYKKGRGEVNILAPGSDVNRPQNNLPYQLFQQIDRVERQLRIGAGYAMQDDGESPIDYATGRGIENLGISMSNEVREYQLTTRYACEDIDTIRLEWDEVCYGGMSKPILGEIDEKSWTEYYDPATAINGRWRSKRIYGVMAGWDEPSKMVTGLQLLAAEVLDTQTFQENIDGMDEVTVVQRRIRKEKAEKALYRIIEAAASQPENPMQPNPEVKKARMALIEIAKDPDNFNEIFDKFYTAEEPQMSPEQQAMLGQGAPDPMAQMFGGGGAPPGVQTVLSRLEMAGGAEGGAQTVETL